MHPAHQTDSRECGSACCGQRSWCCHVRSDCCVSQRRWSHFGVRISLSSSNVHGTVAGKLQSTFVEHTDKFVQSVPSFPGSAVIHRHRLVDVCVLNELLRVHDVCVLLVHSLTFDIVALRLLSRLLASRRRSTCSSGTLHHRWVFHRVGPPVEAHRRQLGVASFVKLSLQSLLAQIAARARPCTALRLRAL